MGSSKLKVGPLTVQAILGNADFEREIPQPIQIHLQLTFDSLPAAKTEKLENAIDYVTLCSELRFIVEESHFILIETLAEALAQYTLFRHASLISEVELSIAKPMVVIHGATPVLTINRSIKEMKVETEMQNEVSRSLVFKTANRSLWFCSILENTSIADKTLSSREMRLNGQVYTWEQESVRSYLPGEKVVFFSSEEPRFHSGKIASIPLSQEDYYLGIPNRYLNEKK